MTVATVTGTAKAAVLGNDLGNAITVNSGANHLDWANGDDSMFVIGGNDTMLGRAGNDRLDGGAGQDVLTGGSETDTFVFATGDMSASQCTAGPHRPLLHRRQYSQWQLPQRGVRFHRLGYVQQCRRAAAL